MSTSSGGPSKPVGKKAIGATTARLRRQMEAFEAARRRTQEKLRKEREELAKDLSEAEKREKRKQRNDELNDQKLIKFVLGGLALAALRQLGCEGLALTAADLGGLSPKHRQLLDAVLSTTNQTSVRPSGDQPSDVDIKL